MRNRSLLHVSSINEPRLGTSKSTKRRVAMIDGKNGTYPVLSEILRKYDTSFDRIENFVNSKQGFFFIFSSKRVEGSRGPYYDCIVGDSRNRIDAKAWISEQGCLEPVIGNVGLADYLMDDRYGLSIKIRRLFSVDEMENYSSGSISQLLPVVEDPERIVSEVRELIDSVKDDYLKALAEKLISEDGPCPDFFEAPAAKMYHHARIGGLAEHSLSVVKYALALTEVSGSRANIDRDLIITGGLFHDIGKTISYTTESFEFDYSDEGYLEEHIAIGARIIEIEISKIKGFPEEKRKTLIHIVLSHHGELQFGSPVTPKTREAILIWLCDNLDSKLDSFETNASTASKGSKWTAFSKMFQSRLYLGERENEKESEF